MKHGYWWWQGSHAGVHVLRVLGVSMGAGRLRVGRPIIFEACVKDFYKLVSSVDREHGDVTDGTIQEN